MVSIGLGDGALHAEFAERATRGGLPWMLVPAGEDAWGGLALTTPCVLRDRHLAALNGAWGLHFDEAEGEWLLDA